MYQRLSRLGCQSAKQSPGSLEVRVCDDSALRPIFSALVTDTLPKLPFIRSHALVRNP